MLAFSPLSPTLAMVALPAVLFSKKVGPLLVMVALAVLVSKNFRRLLLVVALPAVGVEKQVLESEGRGVAGIVDDAGVENRESGRSDRESVDRRRRR